MTVWLTVSSLYIMRASLAAGAPPAATAANKEEGGWPGGRRAGTEWAEAGVAGEEASGRRRTLPVLASRAARSVARRAAPRLEEEEAARRSWESCRSFGKNRNRVSGESELAR